MKLQLLNYWCFWLFLNGMKMKVVVWMPPENMNGLPVIRDLKSERERRIPNLKISFSWGESKTFHPHPLLHLILWLNQRLQLLARVAEQWFFVKRLDNILHTKLTHNFPSCDCFCKCVCVSYKYSTSSYWRILRLVSPLFSPKHSL